MVLLSSCAPRVVRAPMLCHGEAGAVMVCTVWVSRCKVGSSCRQQWPVAAGNDQCVVVAVSCCGTDTLCGGYSGEVILCGVVLCVPPPYHAFVLARLDTRCDLVWCSVSCCVEVSCCCTGTICNVVLCVYVRWQ